MEQYRLLAGVIAAHPGRQIVGRTRLQKTVKLLQALGLPTRYSYTNYFYGPYSDGVQSDIRLLKFLDLVAEEEHKSGDGNPYYVFKARPEASSEALARFQPQIDKLNATDPTILELAATYGAYREMGDDPETAMSRLHRKKGAKCDSGRAEAAVRLLRELGLEK